MKEVISLEMTKEDFEYFVDMVRSVNSCVLTVGEYYANNEVCDDCTDSVKTFFQSFDSFADAARLALDSVNQGDNIVNFSSEKVKRSKT